MKSVPRTICCIFLPHLFYCCGQPATVASLVHLGTRWLEEPVTPFAQGVLCDG